MRRASLLLILSITAACSEPAEPPPDPRIAALREAPARCGAAAYRWLDDKALGDIVTVEELPAFRFAPADLKQVAETAGLRLGRPLRYGTAVWRFRYKTQDRGAWTEATSLLAVPTPAPGEPQEFPVLAFLHGTSGFNGKCAPSAQLLEPALSAALASLGYVVVSPDYLGMNGFGAESPQLHPYLAGEPTAIASLDAVRGARKLLAGQVDSDVRPAPGLLVLGGSQGGHAALFTSRYAPYYAPDEKVIAVAASVPPADLLAEGERASESKVNATFNFMAVLSAWADWYRADLTDVLQPALATKVPNAMRTTCSFSSLQDGVGSIEEIFTPAFRESAGRGFPEDGGRWSCMLRENSLTHTSVAELVATPTIYVLSEEDDLVHTPIERHSFDRLCDQGAALQYLECAGAGHTQGAVDSITEQLDFLDARRANQPWPAQQRCHRASPVTCSGAAD